MSMITCSMLTAYALGPSLFPCPWKIIIAQFRLLSKSLVSILKLFNQNCFDSRLSVSQELTNPLVRVKKRETRKDVENGKENKWERIKKKVKVKQVPDDHVQRQEGPSPLEQRPVHHTSQGAHLLSINLQFYHSYQPRHNYQLIIIPQSYCYHFYHYD